MNRRQLIKTGAAAAVVAALPSVAMAVPPRVEVLPVWDTPAFYHKLGSLLLEDMNKSDAAAYAGLKFLWRYPDKAELWRFIADDDEVRVVFDVSSRPPERKPTRYTAAPDKVTLIVNKRWYKVVWDARTLGERVVTEA